ncbi:MAG: TPM domain-containing protein, partial [Gimesia sp.]
MNISLHRKRAVICLLLLFLFVSKGITSAPALELSLDPPGDREFVRDLAGMLDEKTSKQIKEICDKLLTDKATPIIVVTIDSMAKYGGADMRIETFATILFNQWQIGHAKLGDEDWNT